MRRWCFERYGPLEWDRVRDALLASAILAAGGVALAWWLTARPPESNVACAQRYAHALTAADTTRVDRSLASFKSNLDRPVTCGVLRLQSGR